MILLDETLQYLAKALNVRSHDGNLAVTTLTFIKELCTAASNVPQTAVVATLTSSNLEDYASACAARRCRSGCPRSSGVPRTSSRLSRATISSPSCTVACSRPSAPAEERRKVADAYADWYESLADAVPASYREAGYRERLALAFPFHPELVDILTNRWGSLSGFQRTRGALRTLAHTVKALAQHHHKAPLIHPGDVILADPGIRGEVMRFAGESYKSALNADIIRPESIAPGGRQAARRPGGGIRTSPRAWRRPRS